VTPSNSHIGPITKEEFMDLPDRNKWGVLFEILVADRIDQKDRCEACLVEYDSRYQRKQSSWWTVIHLGIIGAAAAVGGFVAALLGYPIPGGRH
jgi:hypothetical protein